VIKLRMFITARGTHLRKQALRPGATLRPAHTQRGPLAGRNLLQWLATPSETNKAGKRITKSRVKLNFSIMWHNTDATQFKCSVKKTLPRHTQTHREVYTRTLVFTHTPNHTHLRSHELLSAPNELKARVGVSAHRQTIVAQPHAKRRIEEHVGGLTDELRGCEDKRAKAYRIIIKKMR